MEKIAVLLAFFAVFCSPVAFAGDKPYTSAVAILEDGDNAAGKTATLPLVLSDFTEASDNRMVLSARKDIGVVLSCENIAPDEIEKYKIRFHSGTRLKVSFTVESSFVQSANNKMIFGKLVSLSQ